MVEKPIKQGVQCTSLKKTFTVIASVSENPFALCKCDGLDGIK